MLDILQCDPPVHRSSLLKVTHSLRNSFIQGHVLCETCQSTLALFASPFHDLGLLRGAVTQIQSADVLLQQEVVVDAGGHVGEPHVQTTLAVPKISRKLWTQDQFEDRNLLSQTLISQ